MPKRHLAETIRHMCGTSFQRLKMGLNSSMLVFNVGSCMLMVIQKVIVVEMYCDHSK